MNPGPRPTDDAMTATVEQLRDAGLLTIGLDAEGQETWTLTPKGPQVARQLAIGDEATFNATWTRWKAGHEKRPAPSWYGRPANREGAWAWMVTRGTARFCRRHDGVATITVPCRCGGQAGQETVIAP